jgi:hypothetical protein
LVPFAQAQTTHAGYVDEVNAICKQVARNGRDRLDNVQPTGNPIRDLIRKSAVYAKLLGRAARRIESVEPPAEDQKAVESWIAGIRREKRLIERFDRALKRGKPNRAQDLARRSRRVRDATKEKANELGLTACGGSVSR